MSNVPSALCCSGIVVPATFLVSVMYWFLVFDWVDPEARVISFLTHGDTERDNRPN